MFACHDIDIDMNCLHINVRRLLDFVDVFRVFKERYEEWKTRVRSNPSLWIVVRSVWMVGLKPVEEKSRVVVLSFGVRRILLGVISSDIMRESGGEAFRLDEGAD
nr:hypothetical protein [Tanacetum cinerariifolium]